MKTYREILTEAKGFIVKSVNTKEYLKQFDFEGKKQKVWTKDKNSALVFPDMGSAEKAIEITLGKRTLGAIQKA
jgi:hypothetical protein